MSRGRPRWTTIADWASAAFAWTTAATAAGGLAWLLITVGLKGLPELSWALLVESPRDAGRAGGVGPLLVSTLLILGVSLAASLPLGLAAAAMLSETGRRDRWEHRLVRRSLDVLAGVPSIVFGLFGNALFCLTLGMGYSILSGGLTLACMILPILIRVAEQGMRNVPAEYRQAAAALGLSQTTVLWRVVVPAALPAVAVGVVLGVGRALAETAALIFTSGYVTRMPTSVWDSGRSLSVHVFDLAMHVPGGNPRAYASATLLVLLLLGINGLTVCLASKAQGGFPRGAGA